MPGPLFSASRASRRLRWPPEPSPAASLGDVGSVCRPRLAPALPAAPRLPPVAPAPRTATRPLERAVDAHTAGRGALSVDALASLLGRSSVPRRASRPSTARWHSASPRIRCGRNVTGKLQDRCVLAGEVGLWPAFVWHSCGPLRVILGCVQNMNLDNDPRDAIR